MRAFKTLLLVVLGCGLLFAGEVKRNPSVLFCSPHGAGYAYVDLQYLRQLHAKGFEPDYTERLSDVTSERISKYNVVVLYMLPEGKERSKFVKLLERYVSEGGGVLLMPTEHNIVKQALWELTELFGAKLPVEAIIEKDKNNLASLSHMYVPVAYTDQILPSPLSDGVRGIWYPYKRAYNAQHTGPIYVDKNWQVVVKASKTAVTEAIDLTRSSSPELESPFIRKGGVSQPDLFAIRAYKHGRVALINQWRQYSIGAGTKWLYNREILSKGVKGKPSDFGQLFENTLRWLAEPSLKKGSPGGYVMPKDRLIPPNHRPGAKEAYNERFWVIEPEVLGYGRPPKKARLLRGIIGARTSYSIGSGSVEQYADSARKAGLDFVVFTDDFKKLTPESFERLKKDCKKFSGKDLKLFAGFTIKNNIGNYLFFFAPEPELPPDYCLTGPDKKLLNQQYQDESGKFGVRPVVLGWILRTYHVLKGQVGFYNFTRGPKAMKPADLRTYAMLATRYYKNHRLVEDVTDDYLLTAQGTLPPAPVSFNEVLSPQQLIDEVRSGNALIYAQARSLDTLFKDALRWTHQYDGINIFASDGPLIHAWPACHRVSAFGGEAFITGRAVMPSRIYVTSDVGLREINIYNGSELYRRFLPNGAKEFSLTLVLEGTVQKNLVLIAEDVKGGKAVSFARRCWKDGVREVVFCSDHVNDCKSGGMLLGRGPVGLPVSWVPPLPGDIAGGTWDGGPSASLPLVRFEGSRPRLDTNLGTEDADQFNQVPLLEFTDEGASAVSSHGTEIFDPRVPVLNPWHTYGPKEPSKLFDYTLRYREYVTPTVGVPATGWAGPGVRVGVNASIFRGEIRAKKDLIIEKLRLIRNWHRPPVAPAILVVSRARNVDEYALGELNKTLDLPLSPGDWFGLYSPAVSSSHLFFVRKANIRLQVYNPSMGGNWISLWADARGTLLKKGETFSYEISSLGFPVNVDVNTKEDLLSYVAYLREPTGLRVERGKRIESPGLVELEPDDFAVEFSIPRPEKNLQLTLPIRVRGLNRRWSTGLYLIRGYVKGHYGKGKNRYRALGLDVYGNAYAPAYVSLARTTHIIVGHPVVADREELFIQVTHLRDRPHKWHISVNNPTDKTITTTLRRLIDLPGMKFKKKRLTLPPGSYLLLEHPKP